VTAYVVNQASGTVTPINTATGKAGPAIPTGNQPFAAAMTPNGKTLYVVNGAYVCILAGPDGRNRTSPDCFAPAQPAGDGNVTPINTATNKVGKPIDFQGYARLIAITPNGRSAYVLSVELGPQGWVTPINTATGTAGKAITLGTGSNPGAIAITPNGKTVYVTATVARGVCGSADCGGGSPAAGYAAGSVYGTLTPISAATSKPGKAIKVSGGAGAIAIIPNGVPRVDRRRGMLVVEGVFAEPGAQGEL
jgi:YVTN family beta-propeller protein